MAMATLTKENIELGWPSIHLVNVPAHGWHTQAPGLVFHFCLGQKSGMQAATVLEKDDLS